MDIPFPDDVTCLSRVFDNEMKLTTHNKRLAGECYYHLHQMHSVHGSLSINVTKTLVNEFVISQIDYYNCVFSWVTVTHLCLLQSVLNSAARLILMKCKYDQITATICDVLHWLPGQQKIEYKHCDLVYKTMNHTALVYLT